MKTVIDLAQMLAPLPDGEGGVGRDLREDYSPSSPYQKLRDARAEARAEERAQDAAEGEEGVPQPWREVKRLGALCLSEQTRDLEIAAWLAEALVRLDGLEGLHDAARLLSGLLESYWDGAYPLPDEDGLEGRAAPLAGLAGQSADGTLMQPLRRLPLFHRADGSAVSLYVWNLAEDTAALADARRREARHASGIPQLSALEQEAVAAGAQWRALGDAARATAEAWAGFDAQLTARFGEAAPPTRRVADLLARFVELATRFGGAAAPAVATAPSPAPAAVVPQPVGAAPAVVAPIVVAPPTAEGAVLNRESAIRQLESLAVFFRQTEPHSPLAYAIETLARRARMPLPALLEEVLPDAAARHAMLSMLGINPGAAVSAPLPPQTQENPKPAPETPPAAEPKGIVW
ncbi:type VI secretion system protein TssA [Roseomonas sp. USHLN139]|uniref:type VI secretion system protein TssA n=1 Tax=Roseomonas sp. USHLN139 TaxID=3081298 RepID=UPI003B01ABC0